MTDPQPHDTGYKLLFSHAELVQQLLEGFAPPELVSLLDFSTLKLASGSYVTPAMKQREDDVVWSVSMGESTLYLYILLEFQSTVDAAMPVRMMQYVSALYESLIKEKSVNPTDGLPPVFPIVLYNGDNRWQVSTNIGELINCPNVLKPYQPNMAYYLLDEGAYSEDQLNSAHNAVAAVFSLENATNYEAAVAAIQRMAKAIQALPDKQRIDKAISYWIKRHLQRNLPEVIIPQTEQLLENTSMLATNMQKWYKTAQTLGKLEGFASLLEVQIRAKFHDANDADFMPKLHTADQEDLMRYSVQLLSARTLEQVFA
ncbi:MAG TPA: Rpn family recombination-promoting nuclease/putative transposase [Thiotrichales bacterium]|nr:Rpn family recombination-promoting nuclease/putative transposase [Thiotrichales bacterium]